MDCNVACTPKGIIDMLKFYNIPLEGKDVVIINRSNIVGKPLAQLFLKENATVTIAHSKTRGLVQKIFRADIVVTAVGEPGFLSERNFSNGTTIIDVSINFVDGKMCGDIPREDVEILAHRCNITPVPGGVGQTTVIALIENLIEMLEK
jgi:methylenetetrahydrofolate dehydrogenase (NADP+)/methenyltetrahydrofolate cyclohydrolase